ncbi:MAG: tetratricopeptide repeat protein [Magnetococcales bacterium]|nr:tetratricopeptide repeat protein [Magnetococcales bacterium]
MRSKNTRAHSRPTPAAPPSQRPTALDLARTMREGLQQHQAGQLQAAETLYRQALAMEPKHAEALHLLGFIFHQRGQQEMAADWIGQAVTLQPDRPVFLNNLGIVLTALGRQEEAATRYRQALALEPNFYMALGNLGGILIEQGHYAEAIDCYQKALASQPNSPELHTGLGNALLRNRQYAESMACYQRAIQIQPDGVGAYNGLGTALRSQDRLAEAITCYQQGLAIDPNHYDIQNNLGSALLAQGKLDEALACYQQAIRLHPDRPNAYHNAGNTLRDQGKLDEAIACHQKALALNPRLYQTLNSLGNAWQEQGNLDEAVACYRQALAIHPDDTDTLSNLGVILTDQKNWDESMACYQKAATLAPDKPSIQCELLNQMLHVCDWAGFQSHYQQLMTAFHVGQQEASPFVFLALPTTPAEQHENAARFMRNKYPARAHLAATQGPERPPARLKIGYLSSDFQNHPVAYLTAELFELHDRNRFEITAYSYGPDDGREMRQRIRAASDHFVDLRPLTHREAAQRIVTDGTHILMDLNGFTKLARIPILALRPAPIQATWLGYLGTLGAPFIDYLISDSFITPTGCEADFSEKLIRLPECFQPNDRQRPISPHTPTRRERGLPEKGFIFASFNKSYKINPELFTVWMRILHQAPDSILWLVAENQRVEDNLRREAAARGVDPARLFFIQKMPLADYLANYRLVDLVLDTYPYNSGTTASNGLWAGCPLLTCAGPTFVSRQAGSLLRGVGLPELVTHSLADYEALALALARDPSRLLALRQRLQANLPTTPLFDSPRFIRHLEAAYEAMWHRFQAGLAPDHIAVAPLARATTVHPPQGTPVTIETAPTAAEPATPAAPTLPTPATRLQEAMQRQQAGQLAEAEALYRQLLAEQPDQPAILHLLGQLSYQQGQLAAAADWIRQAAALRPNEPVFWQNLGIIQSGLGQQMAAIDCFQKVLALQPQHAEALHFLGNCWRDMHKRTEAIACYRQAVAIQPALYDVYNSLGNLLLAEGQRAEAIDCYRQTVALCPHHQNGYTNLGNALVDNGDTEEAIACYQQALAIQPSLCEAHNGLGNALRQAGKLDEAIACFQRALAINPQNYTAYHNQGVTRQMQGNLEEAIECYHKVLELQPNSYETYNNLGSALANQGQTDEAIACYHKALAIHPTFHSAYGNIGIALQKRDDLEQAIVHYRQALSLCPTDRISLSNLAFALQLQGDVEQSIACYQQVLDRAPDDPEAHGSVLHQRLQICDWQGYQTRLEQMMVAFQGGTREVNPFILLSLPPTTPEEQKTCAILSSQRKYAVQKNMAATRTYAPHPPRLKIGYLSCDYQDHATTHLMAELFELHDRNRFEIIAYSYGQDDGLSMRRRVIAACERFVDLRTFSHQAAAQRILDDGVHILLELKGYTKDSRLEIPALRPAPIQASWLGFPGTVGAPFIDYVLTDPIVTPHGFEAHFTEKIVRLDGCYQPNDRKRPIAPHTPSRQACGLPEQGLVFACFNKNYKINPPIFDIWMRLLQKTPGSVFWLFESNHWVIDNIRREARDRGVAEERLVFAPKMPAPHHLARYRLADIVLDTFPYTSHTTGSDALWAGCPLLTYAGQTFASRVAASLLVNVGLPELITYSLAEYESLALELAHDPARLAALRHRLQANLATAPLFDSPRFTRSLEAAYELMWSRFQAGLAPDHIDVHLEGPTASLAWRYQAPQASPPPRPAAPPVPSPLLTPVAMPVELPVAERLAAAQARHQQGEWDAALALYQPILAQEPHHAEALYGEALALAGKGLVEEGLARLVLAKGIAPNPPAWSAGIQALILQGGERYNACLKANDLERAARVLDALSLFNPNNLAVQEQAFILFQKVGYTTQTLRVAKALLQMNPAHFLAHQVLVADCQARQDQPGELALRIELARRHPRTIPTAFHLQEVYMALSSLLLSPLDAPKVALIEELQALARTIVADNPVAAGDELYHSALFYQTSIDALHMQAVIRPLPPPAPWPDLEWASATGKALDLAAVHHHLTQTGAEILFYVAADPVYIAQHARRYVSSLLQHCEVPFVVIVQVIGGMGRLAALAATIGIQDERLIWAADDFDPASVHAVTWKVNEVTPIRVPLVYYQSARFLWLGHMLEQFNRPVIVSDIDQLLQRGIRDMLEAFATCDVVFHEGIRNIKIADRLVANLLLVQPTATGRLFAQFFRYYMDLVLRDAERKGHYAYFLDQSALLMARHHLQWMTQPRLGTFDLLDVNTAMIGSYQKNPLRFLSFYTGFDMASLPEAQVQ